MCSERTATSCARNEPCRSWFLSHYGMNLYRGCAHNCTYCDGRAEKYSVEGAFGEEVAVKVNAIELLRDYGWPVHVLTKSTLAERDLDVLKSIHRRNGIVVSFNFSSADDRISARFEPGVPTLSERLRTLATFKKEGIPTGMFLLPVIPFITDAEVVMEETVRKARDSGMAFIIYGRQKEYFLAEEFYNSINRRFIAIARKYGIPRRMPPALFRNLLSPNDLAVVILEHMDYLLRLEGKGSSYRYAADRLSKLEEPLAEALQKLSTIRGISPSVAQVIGEVLNTGSCRQYEVLMRG